MAGAWCSRLSTLKATYPVLIIRLSTRFGCSDVPLPLAPGRFIPTLHSPYDYLLLILYYLYIVDKREKIIENTYRQGVWD